MTKKTTLSSTKKLAVAANNEVKRQARMAKESAIAAATRAAYEAQKHAAAEPTPPAARKTFWQRFKEHMAVSTKE